jgi:hypothetical protein
MRMKNSFLNFCLLLLAFFCLSSLAPGMKIIYRYKAFFACEQTDSFSMSKGDFEKLMASNLCAKDSANNLFTVTSFEITYAERGLYQDSTGLPIVFTDYSNQICKGDSIPKQWQADFKDRGYKGDTVFFDRITVNNNGKSSLCNRIKCVIK